MINETNIYKAVNAKQFIKSKYLLSDFFKNIYNTLKANENFGATKRFTIVSEAIFFMLSDNKPQTTWEDYSGMLEVAYKQTTDFPTYLQRTFDQIKNFFNTCPVVAVNSNESTLLGIVEKLLIKCVDNTDTEMEIDDSGNKFNAIATEDIVRLIGPPMVSYGLLERLPDAESFNGPFFMTNLSRFVNQLSINTEIVKRIVENIPLEFGDFSVSLRNSEEALVTVLNTYKIKNFKELVEIINKVLKELGAPTLKDLLETAIRLNKTIKQLQLEYTTLERNYESKPELDCNIGSIAIRQFQNYKINYIDKNEKNPYNFHLEALQMFARCYVIALSRNFCKSEEELNRCKSDQNYFLSKLNSYIEFSSKKTTHTELITFKNEIFYYVGSQNNAECVAVLKNIVEIYQLPNLTMVYSETKILFELIGINNGTTAFIKALKSFLGKYGEHTDFSQTMLVVEKTLSLVGTNKSAIECEKIIESLVAVCGKGGETVEKILGEVQKIKNVYSIRLPEEEFSIGELSIDLESFIDKNDTDRYVNIPGDTNSQKLEYVHENLTEPLKELVVSDVNYSDLVKFLKKLVDEKTAKLDKASLDTIVERHRKYESMEHEKQSVETSLKNQNLLLENCTKNLEDYKTKYETSVKTNNDYADKLKELEKECAAQTKIKQDYDLSVQQLNQLKKEYTIMENMHKLVQLELNEIRKKETRQVATVRPKKRKLSEPGADGSSSEKRRDLE